MKDQEGILGSQVRLVGIEFRQPEDALTAAVEQLQLSQWRSAKLRLPAVHTADQNPNVRPTDTIQVDVKAVDEFMRQKAARMLAAGRRRRRTIEPHMAYKFNRIYTDTFPEATTRALLVGLLDQSNLTECMSDAIRQTKRRYKLYAAAAAAAMIASSAAADFSHAPLVADVAGTMTFCTAMALGGIVSVGRLASSNRSLLDEYIGNMVRLDSDLYHTVAHSTLPIYETADGG